VVVPWLPKFREQWMSHGNTDGKLCLKKKPAGFSTFWFRPSPGRSGLLLLLLLDRHSFLILLNDHNQATELVFNLYISSGKGSKIGKNGYRGKGVTPILQTLNSI